MSNAGYDGNKIYEACDEREQNAQLGRCKTKVVQSKKQRDMIMRYF